MKAKTDWYKIVDAMLICYEFSDSDVVRDKVKLALQNAISIIEFNTVSFQRFSRGKFQEWSEIDVSTHLFENYFVNMISLKSSILECDLVKTFDDKRENKHGEIIEENYGDRLIPTLLVWYVRAGKQGGLREDIRELICMMLTLSRNYVMGEHPKKCGIQAKKYFKKLALILQRGCDK